MQRREFLRYTTLGAATLHVASQMNVPASLPAEAEEGREKETAAHYPGAKYLSGPWRVRLDLGNIGKRQDWFQTEPGNDISKSFRVIVPACLQEYVPGFAGGIAWYFKEFRLPSELEGRALRLKFWAVDYFAEVWVNGAAVGKHEGGHTPFELNITAHVKFGGENRLAVRVVDPARPLNQQLLGLPGWENTSDGVADEFSFNEIPPGLQSWQEGFNISGIWQPVELIETDRVYLRDVFIEPRLAEGGVDGHLEIVNTEAAPVRSTLTCKVRPWKGSSEIVGQAEKTIQILPGPNRIDVRVTIKNPHLWSTEDPYLYVAEVSIRDQSKLRHTTTTRFGMRDFTVKDGFFYLNGKRVFVKGGQHQRTYPTTLAFPPTREFAFNEVRIIKEAGFNFTRMAINPMALPFIDAADELGLLLLQDMAISNMHDSPQMLPRGLREVIELVQRDRNRPSVVMWCMINEMAPALAVVKQLASAARKTDPTRLVMENTGGRTHYYLPYSDQGISYLDEHYYPGAPIGEDVYEYCYKRGRVGDLNFHTEFGIGGMNDIESVLSDYGDNPKTYMEDYAGNLRLKEMRQQWLSQSAVLKQRYANINALVEPSQTLQAGAVRRLTEAMRANPAVSGYDYCQVFDSNAVELDGLADFWRNKRKKAFYEMKELNRPLVMIIQCSPWNSRSGEELKLRVVLVNEEVIQGRKNLAVRVKSPAGREIFAKNVTIEAKPWVSVPFEETFKPDAETGRYDVEATLSEGKDVLAERRDRFLRFHSSDIRWSDRPVALFDPEQRLEPFLRERSVECVRIDSQLPRPTVIVIAPFTDLARYPEQFGAFNQSISLVQRGCTAVVLGETIDGQGMTAAHVNPLAWLSALSANAVFPFLIHSSEDVWKGRVGPYSWGITSPDGGIPVPQHPIFGGVPDDGFMGCEFGNVAPTHKIEFNVQPEEDLGPSVQVYAHGNGKLIVSCLNLLPNLRRDALAEKLLANLIGYAEQIMRPELATEQADSAETMRFEQMGFDDCMTKFEKTSPTTAE